jgi:hypothetical protein
VGHIEIDEQGGFGRQFTRWRFAGTAIFTCVALTSLERDRLHDEMLRVFAFGDEFGPTSQFRQIIEDNEFIAMNMSFDEIGVRGAVSTPGTPWGTDDYMYEITLSLECVGEFYADSTTFTLAPINELNVFPVLDGQEFTSEDVTFADAAYPDANPILLGQFGIDVGTVEVRSLDDDSDGNPYLFIEGVHYDLLPEATGYSPVQIVRIPYDVGDSDAPPDQIGATETVSVSYQYVGDPIDDGLGDWV